MKLAKMAFAFGVCALPWVAGAAGPTDGSLYRIRRAVELVAPPGATSRVPLVVADPTAVALVDAAGHSQSFRVQIAAAQQALPVQPPVKVGGGWLYRLDLPAPSVQLREVRLEVAEGQFNRPFELRAQDATGAPLNVSAGRLFRKPGLEVPLAFAVDPDRLTGLALWLEDEKIPALTLRSVRANLVVAELVTAAPAGKYTLLLEGPPSTLAQQVTNGTDAAALTARMGPSEENPEFRRRARAQWFRHVLPGAGVLAALCLAAAAVGLRLRRRRSAGA
ncbi:MAG TPA: hypothetical protein VEY30_00480 [Myxococcaceae bacterium]|nr:hypothetical protein [Myxococcaceae bacterium]